MMGMACRLDDIINKWLTVGTESKATKKKDTHMKIENGIDHIRAKARVRKGIGRLFLCGLGLINAF